MSTWKDKTVVVTGGSKGLGRSIALAFAERSADVVVLSRDEPGECSQSIPSIRWIQTDVTDDASVKAAIQKIEETNGRIDVWVNNVGRSTRARAEEVSVEQCRQFMEVNFYSVVRCTTAALPFLKKTSGHVVNISSLAGKTAWPLTTPYSTSKHAVTAYTKQLQLEGPHEVHYLLVCPGPIKRTDESPRYTDGSEGLSDLARLPGAGAPVKGIPPEVLARKIVIACEKRKLELVIPFRARVLFTLSQMFPGFGIGLIRRFTNKSSS